MILYRDKISYIIHYIDKSKQLRCTQDSKKFEDMKREARKLEDFLESLLPGGPFYIAVPEELT